MGEELSASDLQCCIVQRGWLTASRRTSKVQDVGKLRAGKVQDTQVGSHMS
jgi:hypothetical protein